MDSKFLFASIIFLSFLIWFQSAIGVAVVSGNPNLTITTPQCDIEGWDAPIDIAVCSYTTVGFFFQLASLNSGFMFINIVITAMVIVIVVMGLSIVFGAI